MENRARLLSSREWLYLAIGLTFGIGWYVYNRQIDFGPYPYTADAVNYAEIGNSFTSIWEALKYSGFRTFGFPLFLFLIKSLVGWFGIESASGVDNAQSIALLLFHFASSLVFYRTFRTLARSFGVNFHPLALLLLVAHPGLVAHTSILLTDTFATDLLLLAASILVSGDSATTRGLLWRGGVTGLILGLALVTRPFFIAALASGIFLSVIVAAWSRKLKSYSLFLIPMLASIAMLLAPSVTTCTRAHGTFCLQNPSFSSHAAANSLQMGLLYFRTYWSIRSQWPESQIILPLDAAMAKNWETACRIGEVTGPKSWLGCVFSRPLFLPVYVGKKIIAVFDSFFLQPYASDVTPAWARRYSRVFGTLSFVGFFYSLWLLGVFIRRKRFWETQVFLLPILSIIFQIPMHVEGRYSFPAVPLALLSLFCLLPAMYSKGRREFTTSVVIGVILAGTFLVQTYSWDLDDIVLQQIEGRDRQ